MKEIPILFSTHMVQAILAGRKTMTRRLIKDECQPVRDEIIEGVRMLKPSGWPLLNEAEFKERFCRYGAPGDLLWVRESWRGIQQDFGPDRIEFKASEVIDVRGKWKPSIHMKKEAARIWLQMTDVRVERLRDISEADAIAEGVGPKHHRCLGLGYYESGGEINDCECLSWDGDEYVMGFKDLWSEINGADSWNANPWVWVVSFEVLSTTGKPSTLTEKSNS